MRGESEGSSLHLYSPEDAAKSPTAPIVMEQGTPTVTVDIEGAQRDLILDTGSNISILQPGVSQSDVRCTSIKPYGVTGETLEIRGQQAVSFRLDGHEFKHPFYVCPLPTNADGLIGLDFMEKTGANLDIGKGKISLTGVVKEPKLVSSSPSRQAALTIFTPEKEGHSPSPRKQVEKEEDGKVNESTSSWLIKSIEDTVIEPRSRQIVLGRLDTTKKEKLPTVVCVEPAVVPIHGIHPARVLTRVQARPNRRIASPQGRIVSEAARNCACVMITNFSDEALTVPKATVLGVAEEMSESVVDRINTVRQSGVNTSRGGRNVELYHKLLKGKLDHLPPQEKQLIEPILVKYAHVFHDEELNDFKATNVVEYEIPVGDSTPIRRPPYKTPFALRDEMDAQVQKMLRQGVIRESDSPWSAPAILVPKKSLDGKPKYRFCVDFRALNAVTRFNPYPLPPMDEATATLYGSRYFSVLDCFSGFLQVNIKEAHRERTAFSVPSGHYEFTRLPFGLANSPAYFQRLMDTVLKNLVGTECYIYLDDCVIFSNTAEEHARRLEHVLQRFDQANLQLHPGKCAIAQPKVKYLGFELSDKGVSATADKVEAIKGYPTPKNARDVRAFIGLASFYRRLVPSFAEIAKPLTMLTRKNQEFSWGQTQQVAFDTLKQKLSTTPVLAFPNFGLPFILTTDASKVAIAAVLSQVQGGVERPIAFASRQKNTPEQAYTASESEMLALVWATKFFRCYLYGRKFLARTDHSALTYLRNFSDQNQRLMRWSMKLSELDFTVEHRAGKKIPHVDALSRHVGSVLNGNDVNRVVVREEQAKDKFCQSLNIGSYNGKQEFFRDTEGLIYRRRRRDRHQLVVPTSIIQDVIRANHDPSFVAHPGIHRTHSVIALNYWWPGMRKSIEDYVRRCDSCQRRKEDRQFTAPLGTPEVPERPFQITSMDITGPYPLTPRRNKYLLTFVDHFSKYAEAFPIPDQSAEVCARVYTREIVARHGTGSVLVTDQGSAFMSSFFGETCKVLGIKRIHTSSFHPQSNGTVERWHRTLHTGLSHLVNHSHTDWDLQVPFFLMGYRATPHTTTGYSPFYLLHGREMALPGTENLKAKVPTNPREIDQRVEDLKASLRSAFRSVKWANKKSHLRNKKYHDRSAKHRVCGRRFGVSLPAVQKTRPFGQVLFPVDWPTPDNC